MPARNLERIVSTPQDRGLHRLVVDLVARRRVDVADPESGEVLGAIELVDDALSGRSVPWDCLEADDDREGTATDGSIGVVARGRGGVDGAAAGGGAGGVVAAGGGPARVAA
jgi:hypothetical protein